MACLHSLYGLKIFSHTSHIMYSIILNHCVDEKSVDKISWLQKKVKKNEKKIFNHTSCVNMESFSLAGFRQCMYLGLLTEGSITTTELNL